MGGIAVRVPATFDVVGNVIKAQERELLSTATANHAIEEFASLQDALNLKRRLPEAMGYRVAIRLRPMRNKVKFSKHSAKIGWRERGALFGLIRPMRLVMEGYHSYGKRRKARVIKAKAPTKIVNKAIVKVPKVKPKDNHRHFQAHGWEVTLLRKSKKMFVVVREQQNTQEGELQQFTTEHEALQLYAQWIIWARHQRPNSR